MTVDESKHGYPPIERNEDRIFLSTWPGARPSRVPDSADVALRWLEHTRRLRPDQPCGHPGCLHHVTHPCEGCGRIAGVWPDFEAGKRDAEIYHAKYGQEAVLLRAKAIMRVGETRYGGYYAHGFWRQACELAGLTPEEADDLQTDRD